jgi:hypothetical protein
VNRALRFTLLGIAVVVVLVAGCGGASRLSKAQYEAAVLGIVRDLQPEADQLFFDIVANDYPRQECATKTARFHGVLREIVDRAEALRPPLEVAGLQTRFLAAARTSVNEVGAAAADVQRGLLSCGQSLNERIYGLLSTARAELVLSEYRQRGYFPYLGGLGPAPQRTGGRQQVARDEKTARVLGRDVHLPDAAVCKEAAL